NVLTRTRLDPGVKHSVGAGVGYVGIIIATIVALDYTGLDLSNLALIAGALSVGIGFGLQNVVNNFVSGIILLIERPIRVGDWIVVGEKEGYVKKISVRATELETFDRQSIVIPNAELINTSVGNWMLKDKTGRLIIEVGVSYDTNEEQVRDIFYRLIAADDRIATYPEPYVYFKDFGDSALIFQLRVILKDVSDIIKVGGDMRFSIRKAFREAGIAIPFPQTDIHIHKTEPTEASVSSSRKDG
ncbi:MAG: mechanosensitive ion channel family protein, partial [Candidatus Zixiibacteriota bacterium]